MREAESSTIPGTYFFFNLGCPKNLVDAERAAALLEESGWEPSAHPADAELLVVTTCAFIRRAEEESIEEILQVAALKSPDQRLAVVGCLVSREGGKLQKLLPEVDLFLSVDEIDLLPERAGGVRQRVDSTAYTGRRLFTPAHLAYLKIADGCSNHCSYCTIPSIRGELVSRARDEIVREATQLVRSGVQEIVMVAQDTCMWGFERTGNTESLYRLVEEIAAVVGEGWLRLLYLHPAHIDPAQLLRILEEGLLCRYLDIPVQHASSRVLERMGRGYRRRELEGLFGELRSRIADIVLRTTVMVGFPGESETDFDELVRFLEDVSFDHVGVFCYSDEEDTRAAGLDGAVPAEVAMRRRDEILDLQMDISEKRLQRRVGEKLRVLVDETAADPFPRAGVTAVGRFYGQAYEIDGVTYLSGGACEPGTFVRASVYEAGAYDVFATAGGEFD